MRKLIALLMAVMLLAALCACGQTEAPAAEPAAEPVAAEPAAEPAAAEPAAEPAAAEPVAEYPEMNLTVAHFTGEADYTSRALQYLCDYVTEKSGGKITFDLFFGSSYCTMPEQFPNCGSGAVDMTTLMPAMVMNQMPFWQLDMILSTYNSFEDSVNTYNYVVNEMEGVADKLADQAAQNNVVILGCYPSGYTTYLSNTDFTSFADLAGKPFGVGRNQAVYEAMGLTVVTCQANDAYESLQRGIINGFTSSLSAVVTNKFYEVAPNVVISKFNGGYALPMVNLDVWNALGEDGQALFREAYQASAEYCLGVCNEEVDGYIAEIEGAGGTVNWLNEEDSAAEYAANVDATYATAKGAAENLGLGEDFDAIYNTVKDYMAG